MTHTTHTASPADLAAIRTAAQKLGADLAANHGKAMATAARAASVIRRGGKPVTLGVRFTSAVEGQDGPTIGEVLKAAGLR